MAESDAGRASVLGVDNAAWLSAIGAGMIAGVAMGIGMQFVMGIMPVVGALYGMKSVLVGWLGHLFHSGVFALFFAGIVYLRPLRDAASGYVGGLVIGVLYGVGVWVFGSVYIMPIWLEAAGLPNPGTPNINVMSFAVHLVYGAVLGATYPFILSQLRSDDADEPPAEAAA